MQKDDDLFRDPDEPDRTVYTPQPGGRRRGGAAAVASADAPVPPPPLHGPEPVGTGVDPFLSEAMGRNSLLRAGSSLFSLVRQLRGTRRHMNIEGLRHTVIKSIKRFDQDARAAGHDAKTSQQAAYALCGLIDETVLSTPWGLESIWSKESLLITFFKEYKAGERFFDFLSKARELPNQSIDLLEFFYVCLSLGFQGRFGKEQGGVDKLNRMRQDLFGLIKAQRGEYERELSPRWRGVMDKRPSMARFVPTWVVGIAGLVIALFAYLGFSYHLSDISEITYNKINSLVPVTFQQAAATPQPIVPPKPDGFVARARITLEPEIKQGLVAVIDRGDTGVIVLFNRGLFPSGGAEVGSAVVPTIRKIGEFLNQYPGTPVSIIGHTDNKPIRTVRFPSNYELSIARADAVAKTLVQTLADKGRIRTDGRADTEPLESNDTEAGRAQNRRVEIRAPVS